MASTGEQLYTLEGAQTELDRRECARFGHSIDTVTVELETGREPVGLSCSRCGRSWAVAGKASGNA